MGYLQGNYELAKQVGEDAPEEKQDPVRTFEDFARERLGGSVAFVMKENTFVWKGTDPAPDAASKPAAPPADKPGGSR